MTVSQNGQTATHFEVPVQGVPNEIVPESPGEKEAPEGRIGERLIFQNLGGGGR